MPSSIPFHLSASILSIAVVFKLEFEITRKVLKGIKDAIVSYTHSKLFSNSSINLIFYRSSRTEFNYDDQTSSNSPRPPAGDGGSSRGYLNTISETVSGFIGGLRRGSSDGPGRNDSGRRNDNERQNDNWDTRSPRYDLRDSLRHIAHSTLQILDEGEYFPPGQDGPYDLDTKILWTDENTRYYGPDAGEGGEIVESEFIKINEGGGDEGNGEKEEERNKDGNKGAGEEASHLNETKQGENESKAVASKPCNDDNANPKDQTRVQTTVSPDPSKRTHTSIYFGEYSTLIGARKVHLALAANTNPPANKKIGVLNFASAKKPGGGFVNGSQAQVRFFLQLPYFSYMIFNLSNLFIRKSL